MFRFVFHCLNFYHITVELGLHRLFDYNSSFVLLKKKVSSEIDSYPTVVDYFFLQ